ncbi:unnamed protein product [Hydatigera taeniaeformis]|uniref:Uncharacterized protein n=1 Tax=Hydatigena taeniaeformis TaxID=6205 RepID=A0A0R3X8P3_HYDTA|nr:unnamed protein product [Hydatigera taeniaeformis]
MGEGAAHHGYGDGTEAELLIIVQDSAQIVLSPAFLSLPLLPSPKACQSIRPIHFNLQQCQTVVKVSFDSSLPTFSIDSIS